ncbi:MAG: maleylpyruvate isomerase family mycothiol-dependent enzyme [Nocardioidaceae bacterium]
MTDELAPLIAAWQDAAADAIALLKELTPQEWELPTDLPGWNVRYVAAHLAHLEAELAGFPQEQVEVPEADHVKGIMGQFTEAGPIARASWTTAAIVDEFERAVAVRAADLTTTTKDPDATADGFAGLVGWTWRTALSNRALDLWVHEQDIRRAIGRPGGLDTAGARHVAGVFAKSFPYVLGKRAGAPIGTTAVLRVTGEQPLTLAAGVGPDGRATSIDPPADPDVTITIGFEDWAVLGAGRRPRSAVDATIEGDGALGKRILDSLAVTP